MSSNTEVGSKSTSTLDKMYEQFSDLTAMYNTMRSKAVNGVDFMQKMVGFEPSKKNYENFETMKARVEKLEGEQSKKEFIKNKLIAMERIVRNYQGDLSDLPIGFQIGVEHEPTVLVQTVELHGVDKDIQKKMDKNFFKNLQAEYETPEVKKHSISAKTAFNGYKDYPKGIMTDAMLYKDEGVVSIKVQDILQPHLRNILTVRSANEFLACFNEIKDNAEILTTESGAALFDWIKFVAGNAKSIPKLTLSDMNIVNLKYSKIQLLRGVHSGTVNLHGKDILVELRDVYKINEDISVGYAKGAFKHFLDRSPIDLWVIFKEE